MVAESGAYTKHINSQKSIKILPMSADILIKDIVGGGIPNISWVKFMVIKYVQ